MEKRPDEGTVHEAIVCYSSGSSTGSVIEVQHTSLRLTLYLLPFVAVCVSTSACTNAHSLSVRLYL